MNDLIIPETAELTPYAVKKVVELETAVKELTKKRDALREAIQAEMEKNGIIKFETPEVMINFIPGTDRETFDSKKFRAEYPEQYDRYVDFKKVKPCIRVKVK